MREYLLFFRPPQTDWQKMADSEAASVLGSVRNLCACLIEDGSVDDDEAKALYETVMECAGLLPKIGMGDLPNRFKAIFEDGVIDAEERAELAEIAKEIIRCVDNPNCKPKVAGLPYSQPDPLDLTRKAVVISGTFQYGKRSKVLAALEAAGGSIESNVTHSTDIVLVGSAPSQGWAHGNYGRKIEDALRMQAEGIPVLLVHELHWRATL